MKPIMMLAGWMLFSHVGLFPVQARERMITGASVVISELMYHPPNESNEFVELHNHGPFALDFTGWTIGGGIIEQIPFGTLLRPDSYWFCAPRSATDD